MASDTFHGKMSVTRDHDFGPGMQNFNMNRLQVPICLLTRAAPILSTLQTVSLKKRTIALLWG